MDVGDLPDGFRYSWETTTTTTKRKTRKISVYLRDHVLLAGFFFLIDDR